MSCPRRVCQHDPFPGNEGDFVLVTELQQDRQCPERTFGQPVGLENCVQSLAIHEPRQRRVGSVADLLAIHQILLVDRKSRVVLQALQIQGVGLPMN